MSTESQSTIYQRFELVAQYFGESLRQLSARLRLPSPQVFYDLKSGKVQGVSRKLLESIKENIPEINSTWIITGEGEMLNQASKRRIPLYDDVQTIGGAKDFVADTNGQQQISEWIDAGDWFPSADAAIHHYGDSMIEYPSGCILAIKRVKDISLLINGENYVIETDEFRITKQVQDDGGDYIMAYSSNRETYPDGHLIHAPIKIAKSSIRHMDLVLGCVVKRFSNGPIRII